MAGRNGMSKEEWKKKQERERRSVLASRQTYALENQKQHAASSSNLSKEEKRAMKYTHSADGYVGGKIEGTEVDERFAADLQKMKFCRKPVGFIMWILYLACIAILVIPFVLPDAGLEQFTSLCQDAPVTETETKTDDETSEEATEDETEGEEEATNAAYAGRIFADGEEDAEDESTEEAEDDAEVTDTADTKTSSSTTYYDLTDPLYGWIKFVAGKLGLTVELGDSPWYDAQISKTEVGMQDTIAEILIWVFPPFLIVYAVLGLTLMIQTLICFASGDRRIFRFTGLESFIMLLCGAIVLLGCMATTVEINGSLDFGNIVTFLLGGLTGQGGFTAGYGLVIMLAIPLVGFILSFFLLEKKLRGREISQPIVVYHYKEK